jgi:hypothetical protein
VGVICCRSLAHTFQDFPRAIETLFMLAVMMTFSRLLNVRHSSATGDPLMHKFIRGLLITYLITNHNFAFNVTS